MKALGEGERSLLSLPITADTLVLRLVCTGSKKRGHHKATQVGLVSWAPDGRETIVHDLTDPRRDRSSWTVAEGADARTVFARRCPKCGLPHEMRIDSLAALLEQRGRPGRVVAVSLLQSCIKAL